MSYDIHHNEKFGSLTLIDLDAEAPANDPWFNQVHRTRAPERTAILMVEPAGVVPTGDDY